MIFRMTVEEDLVKIRRSCSVTVAALDNPDLTPLARDGLSDLLEEAVLLGDVKATLDAGVLNLPLVEVA
jgi:hypothetical protein